MCLPVRNWCKFIDRLMCLTSRYGRIYSPFTFSLSRKFTFDYRVCYKLLSPFTSFFTKTLIENDVIICSLFDWITRNDRSICIASKFNRGKTGSGLYLLSTASKKKRKVVSVISHPSELAVSRSFGINDDAMRDEMMSKSDESLTTMRPPRRED